MTIATLLSSPRRRRRLGWTLGIALAVAGIVAVGINYSNTGRSLETPLEPEAALTTAAPVPKLRMTPAVRREVGETVQGFVRTAVIRRNLADAWPLASPAMRVGLTRRDWERGDIPVQPYPAKAFRDAEWELRYQSARTIGIDVMVQPKPNSGERVMVYAAELTAPGSGPPTRFVVDSWAPLTTLGAAAAPSQPGASRGRGGQATPDLAYDKGKLGAEWFLVPAGIVLLLIATLGAFALRGVLQRRRAERHYRESHP